MKASQMRSKNSPAALGDLSDLRNKHRGKKCFVVGSGPSLFLDDKNIEPIQKHIVISVNASILLMKNWRFSPFVLARAKRNGRKPPTKADSRFWISNDVMCIWWDYFWHDVVHADCTRIVRTSWQGKQARFWKYGFRYFRPRRGGVNQSIDPEDGGLCWSSSVPTGIDLGLLMGCDVYLLGVDHTFEEKTHFWQYWPDNEQPKFAGGKRHTPNPSEVSKFFNDNMIV